MFRSKWWSQQSSRQKRQFRKLHYSNQRSSLNQTGCKRWLVWWCNSSVLSGSIGSLGLQPLKAINQFNMCKNGQSPWIPSCLDWMQMLVNTIHLRRWFCSKTSIIRYLPRLGHLKVVTIKFRRRRRLYIKSLHRRRIKVDFTKRGWYNWFKSCLLMFWMRRVCRSMTTDQLLLTR